MQGTTWTHAQRRQDDEPSERARRHIMRTSARRDATMRPPAIIRNPPWPPEDAPQRAGTE
eukprot:1100143-Alexandrium_andersonii.AAC.1